MEELVKFFENYKKVCNAYTLALSTLYFDKSTIHLSKGVPYRNDMISILAGVLKDQKISDGFLSLASS